MVNVFSYSYSTYIGAAHFELTKLLEHTVIIGHGRCVALYKCDCDSGWTGVSCALPDCAGTNHCSGQGECVARDTCHCYPGFQGANCSKVAECRQFGNCSGNGVCTQEKHGSNLTCRSAIELKDYSLLITNLKLLNLKR